MSESREDFQKRRALDELRKAGAAMPAVDEKGRAINPHIPQYIANAPWYYSTSGPTLKHQDPSLFKKEETPKGIGVARNEVVHVDTQVKGQRFRAGACANCGSMTHNTKQCLERPRRKTAQAANTTFGHDLYVKETKLGFEAKRDQYATIDVEEEVEKQLEAHRIRQEKQKLEHERMVQEKLKEKEEKRDQRLQKKLQRKQAKLDALVTSGSSKGDVPVEEVSTDSDWDESDDSELDTDDETDTLRNRLTTTSSSVNEKLKADGTAQQSLRIREDTAKYLLNLDVDSAYYDPKTRSLRENPFSPDDPRHLLYAGDNKLRRGGDMDKLHDLTMFAHKIQEVADVHVSVFSDPTALELQHKQFEESQKKLEEEKQRIIKQKFSDEQQRAIPRPASEFEDEQDDQHNSHHGDHGSQPSSTTTSTTSTSTSTSASASTSSADPMGLFSATAPSVVVKPRPKKMDVISGPAEVISDATEDVATAKTTISSRYAEDVLEGNHTTIWGSYYDIAQKKWGYACCHSLIRGSYCIPTKKPSKRPRPQS